MGFLILALHDQVAGDVPSKEKLLHIHKLAYFGSSH